MFQFSFNTEVFVKGLNDLKEVCERNGNFEDFLPPWEVYHHIFTNSKYKYVLERDGSVFKNSHYDKLVKEFEEFLASTIEIIESDNNNTESKIDWCELKNRVILILKSM